MQVKESHITQKLQTCRESARASAEKFLLQLENPNKLTPNIDFFGTRCICQARFCHKEQGTSPASYQSCFLEPKPLFPPILCLLFFKKVFLRKSRDSQDSCPPVQPGKANYSFFLFKEFLFSLAGKFSQKFH